jgi:hypothetical protein
MAQSRPTAKEFVGDVINVFQAYLQDEISDEKLLERFNHLMTKCSPTDVSDELLEVMDDIDLDLTSEEEDEERDLRERVQAALSRLEEVEFT